MGPVAVERAELWAPERVRSEHFLLRGCAEGGDLVELTLHRPGETALVLGAPGRFERQVALGRCANGPLRLELWGTRKSGARVRLATRDLLVERPRVQGVDPLAFARTAARKALLALREGRLPASPAYWWKHLGLLWRELAEHGAPTPLAQAKQRLERDARGSLADFLDGGARLRFAPAASPEVSAIVIAHNRAELLLGALRSLPAEVEPIVIDNASTDETPALLARLDGAVVERERENLGFLAAVNRAAAIARGRHLLLLNSDAALQPGALAAALRVFAEEPKVGAVGGRLILPDGTLQEAGSAILSDGGCLGIGRGADPDAPEFAFRREVDFCSGALLVTPRAIFEQLGGFDERYRPAYYEDADYCARLWQRGLRTLYEPAFTARHFEFASARSPAEAQLQQAERRRRFVDAHRDWLRDQPPPTAPPHRLRMRPPRGLRILIVDDRAPRRVHGSGHPRMRAIVEALVARGHFVTLFPTHIAPEDAVAARRELPAGVEVVLGRGGDRLVPFLDERRGAFDRVIVSRRHNLALLDRGGRPPGVPLIYDSEALHDPGDVERAARADVVLAVSEAEREAFVRGGARRVVTAGHALVPAPTARPFGERTGLLMIGAFIDDDSPNGDAAWWLLDELLPRLRRRLGPIWLTLAGARPSRRLVARAGDGVEVLGPVDDVTPLYDRARLFVAPTRIAAGLPHKVHEAAAHGLPVACTPLVAGLLGWGDAELSVGGDPDSFADAAALAYSDEARWHSLRAAALARVGTDCDPARLAAALEDALA